MSKQVIFKARGFGLNTKIVETLQQENYELRQENERLREALMVISRKSMIRFYDYEHRSSLALFTLFEPYPQDIAKKALEDNPYSRS